MTTITAFPTTVLSQLGLERALVATPEGMLAIQVVTRMVGSSRSSRIMIVGLSTGMRWRLNGMDGEKVGIYDVNFTSKLFFLALFLSNEMKSFHGRLASPTDFPPRDVEWE